MESDEELIKIFKLQNFEVLEEASNNPHKCAMIPTNVGSHWYSTPFEADVVDCCNLWWFREESYFIVHRQEICHRRCRHFRNS